MSATLALCQSRYFHNGQGSICQNRLAGGKRKGLPKCVWESSRQLSNFNFHLSNPGNPAQGGITGNHLDNGNDETEFMHLDCHLIHMYAK